MSDNKYNKILTYIFIAILTLGLGLRFYQYLIGRAIWDDEAHLALNIIKYDYTRLAKPLDFIQAAPILFLYSVKTVGLLFGYSEYALRFIPFIATVLTFPLYYYILRDLFKNQSIALIGFFIFSFNSILIYFSSELKQYAMDVAVYLALVYLTISAHIFIAKYRKVLLTIIGSLAILISNVAFIVLFCVGCFFLLKWIKDKQFNLKEALMFLPWMIVFALNYYLFIYNHPSTLDQRTNYAFAFCPTDIFSCEFLTFIKLRTREIFLDSMLKVYDSHGFKYVLLLIFIVGLYFIYKTKNANGFIFTCIPILFHLVISGAKLYPFWYRLILYLLPCFIAIIAVGTYQIARYVANKTNLWPGVLITIVCSVLFVERSMADFPVYPLNIKKAINYINTQYPSKPHIYITTPINPYRYYTIRGYAKDTVYKEVQWAPWWPMTPNEFEEFTKDEHTPFLFVYGANYHEWGYGKIVDHLKEKGRVVKSYNDRGYEVSEIKPAVQFERVLLIDSSYFDSADVWKSDDHEVFIPQWSNNPVVSKPFHLQAGKYNVTVVSKGNSAGGIYPHNNIYLNDNKIGDFNSTYFPGRNTFVIDVAKETECRLKIDMDNDTKIGNEDRNSFVKYIEITRVQ